MEMPACFPCMEESWNRARLLQSVREEYISLLLTDFISNCHPGYPGWLKRSKRKYFLIMKEYGE